MGYDFEMMNPVGLIGNPPVDGVYIFFFEIDYLPYDLYCWEYSPKPAW